MTNNQNKDELNKLRDEIIDLFQKEIWAADLVGEYKLSNLKGLMLNVMAKFPPRNRQIIWGEQLCTASDCGVDSPEEPFHKLSSEVVYMGKVIREHGSDNE